MPVITPREFNPRKTLFVATVLAVLIVWSSVRMLSLQNAATDDLIRWSGMTMGTYYSISIADWSISEEQRIDIQQQVADYLASINQQMSTYIADSEISRFNQSDSTEAFPVSADFFAVVQSALKWAERTGGAFDPTLAPLISLWGFGGTRIDAPPSREEVDKARSLIGFDQIELLEDTRAIRKRVGHIQLNLNAIAKGYAVDGVAALLREAGAENVYVEIGGDVVAFGVNAVGVPWRIGVEMPVPDGRPGEHLHGIAHISHGALAGSGEYRQLVELSDGSLISHIIDPRSGRPVQHNLMSVNVWAPNCTDADAVATALIVMGEQEGLSWIEDQENIEAIFFIRSDADDGPQVQMSSGFAEQTRYTPVP